MCCFCLGLSCIARFIISQVISRNSRVGGNLFGINTACIQSHTQSRTHSHTLTHTHTHTHIHRRKRLIIEKPAIFFDLIYWAEILCFLQWDFESTINWNVKKYHIQGWFYTPAIRILWGEWQLGKMSDIYSLLIWRLHLVLAYIPTTDCFQYIFFRKV